MIKSYRKVLVNEVSIDNCVGGWEPRVDYFKEVESRLNVEKVVSNLSPIKQKVVNMLIDGYNFNQIAKQMNVNQSKIYKIKKQLMIDLSMLKDDYSRDVFVKENIDELNLFLKYLVPTIKNLSLSEFTRLYLYDYDLEAVKKNWQSVAFQDTLEQIWEKNSKSCTLAPREHLKTYSILAYLIKKIVTRDYPLEIDYFHLTDDLALEKFKKIQRAIENNPILVEFLDLKHARYWSEEEMTLKDGTTIKPMSYQSGTVGKHPHIIVIDDPIDRKVIYSDALNKKAIDKFYSDIYPMTTRDDEDRKVIMVGTMQRKDDLYNSLPEDFKLNVFKAINEDGSLLCPEVYTHEKLMKIKSDVSGKHGEKYWLKEYMNVPFEALGLIIKEEWIKTYHSLTPEMYDRLKIYQGWDLSVGKNIEKGDWSVCVTIGIYTDNQGNVQIYILDVYRARIDFGLRLRKVIDKFNEFHPKLVGIEDVAFQYDTVQTIKQKTSIPVKGIKAIKNKVESFQVELAPYFENGKILIREDMKDLINEVLSLPVGDYDDMSDALKIAIKTSLQFKVSPTIRVMGG